MKLSIVLSTQPASFSALVYRGEFEDNIAKIAAFGYDGVELAVRDPGLFDVENIKSILKKNDLEVPAIGTGQAYGEEGLSFTHPDENIRRRAIERVKAHIEFAGHFKAHVIIGLIRGKKPDSVEGSVAVDWMVDAMKECAAAAHKFDVKLAVESINRYETDLVTTVNEGLDLIDKAGQENLGLLLDTFHMNIEEPCIEESIRNAGKWLFHFHIADSNRWYPGAGHIDFRRIVETLHEVGYKGYLSAEILPFPDADTCAGRTIAFMRSIL